MHKTVEVGVVAELNLYPVKSMRAVMVSEAQLYWYGFNGDRKYAFVRSENASGFPWLTGRELPNLLCYQPVFVDKANVLTSPIRVSTPEKEMALSSSELREALSQAYGAPVQLIRLNRGTYDAMPISLLTTRTLETLGRHAAQPLERRRFRANMVIEPFAAWDFPEDAWLGRTLTFGNRHDSAYLRVTHPTKRCVMVNINPDTAELTSSPLATVVEHHEACAGVYAAVERIGQVRAGDMVSMLA